MFDRPPITDDQIVAALRDRYAIRPTSLTFLALGHDAHAWTFRASTDRGDLFVKIRRRVDNTRLRLVRFLDDDGLEAVVAPIVTGDGAVSVAVDELHLIAYPFVEGRLAAEVGLDNEQWTEYGRIVGALHKTRLSSELAASLPREQFRPNWTAQFQRVQAGVDVYRGDDPVRRQLAEFWQVHRHDIEDLPDRAVDLGRMLAARQANEDADVPCHGDIHTHNLLVEPSGGVRVIDWDEALLAPRERDLMFVMGSPIGLAPGDRELALFEAGYGPLAVDAERLAYYHVDWAVQDIAGYAEQALLDDIGPESQAYALERFLSIFEPGGEAEVAHRFDRTG
ncbi:MAG TPA: aminoglycoside phosphotransferase family protein [Candidatus Limnocylindrales bacterium]|nr:aminoglycoside phosphotransferase family protein [Candidatus Limnocylindrales bacterium]